MGLESPLLSLSGLLFSLIRIIKFFQGDSKLTVKFFSGRLNIKPYNKLDKEVIDFKEYKEGLIIQHDIKYFYYWKG